MKILLVGGGTGGSVTPVLAVAEEIKKLYPKTEFLFVGTRKGPEKDMVADFGIPFRSIPAAKFRRYFSLKNLVDIFVLFFGFIQAWRIVRKFQPDAVFGAGAFVQVPVCWAARLTNCRIIVHQQDPQIGLANKLVAPFAHQITTAFEYSAKNFYSGSGLMTKKWKSRAEWVGNPYRAELVSDAPPDREFFGLHDKLPVLLILGGSTGASQINSVVLGCLEELLKSHQVIHQTGEGKAINFKHPDYHQYNFIPFDKYAQAFRLADIIIARAGMSTITELSALGKIAIIIPMPESHQELNARFLEHFSAAVVLFGAEFNADDLPRIVTSLKFNVERQKLLKDNMSRLMPKDAAIKICELIIKKIHD